MSEWLHNLPLGWMVLVVFGVSYLVTWGIPHQEVAVNGSHGVEGSGILAGGTMNRVMMAPTRGKCSPPGRGGRGGV